MTRYIIVVVALATAISLLAQQISSITLAERTNSGNRLGFEDFVSRKGRGLNMLLQ